MQSIIHQIGSFSFSATKLYFDKNRTGQEVKLNLASFPKSASGITPEDLRQLINALQRAIVRMEIAIRDLLHDHRGAIFYMWHDEQANVLRWTIISDVGQKTLPFSSNVIEVDIKDIVKKWATTENQPKPISKQQVEKMTSVELDALAKAHPMPVIQVYVRRVSV